MIDLIESKSNMTCSYIVAASPDPQPRDDVLYKDSVKHSSRALSGPSNTKPLKHRQKTNRRQKTEAKPCQELRSSQTTILPLMLPKLGSQLCCRLQLSGPPVNHSSEGDTQSSWSVIDSCMQPLGRNHGLCSRCRTWWRFSMAMLTSAWETRWKCWSFPIQTPGLIAGYTVQMLA